MSTKGGKHLHRSACKYLLCVSCFRLLKPNRISDIVWYCNLLSGCIDSNHLFKLTGCIFFVASVSTSPGAIMFEVIPYGPSS